MADSTPLSERKMAILQCLNIVMNEPLGYETERDHKILENFADRIEAKMVALITSAEERHV